MNNRHWRQAKQSQLYFTTTSKPVLILSLLLSLVLLMGGCASTRLTSQWSDPAGRDQPLESVMVVGVFDNERDRRLFEDNFVKGFTERGIRALSSAALITDTKPLTKEAVLAATRENNIETIFVTDFVKEEKQSVYRPGGYSTSYAVPHSYHRFGSYYSGTYRRVYEPGYYTTLKSVVLESNLYDAAAEKLIWSAASETFDYSKAQDVIESLRKTVIKELDNQNYLPK